MTQELLVQVAKLVDPELTTAGFCQQIVKVDSCISNASLFLRQSSGGYVEVGSSNAGFVDEVFVGAALSGLIPGTHRAASWLAIASSGSTLQLIELWSSEVAGVLALESSQELKDSQLVALLTTTSLRRIRDVKLAPLQSKDLSEIGS